MCQTRIQPHPEHRGRYRLESAITIPRPIEEVFAFFADAGNLQRITPPWMNFRVVTAEPIEIAAGQLIDYRLRVHGIPLRWRSEITVWEPPHRFVDEQRRGPYRYWHHEHRFEACDEGTRVIDTVDYAVPGGPLIQRLFVRRDLLAIFDFRRASLQQMLNDPSDSGR